MAEFLAEPAGAGRRIAVVASRFNEDVVRRLVDGAMKALVEHGTALEDIDLVWVPGAWELPMVGRILLDTGRYDALVAIGAVIRGETAHFDYVADGASRGLQQLAADYETPVSFGVLTTDTEEQAMERAGGAHGNKGADAALAALEMADLFERLEAAAQADTGGSPQA